ncbi:MAG: hypothetical protein A2113_00705 [Candidatus Woykebacteria bacterium GWA1_44_8]|uniref:Uncharacterized protein n=1 Tax=Candidatus Woykebacteria bacterium GWA1_44_8 TaxID=1802591 RepID=A0A1G1W2M2_9BACT|nr:MAG: hypothetical protein A2113_00705 [Candidatus Woykebacteria bacterium GWA1_44_8]
MLDPYILDYFLFTFFASVGVLQVALAQGSRAKATVGTVVLTASYLWFFMSRDRNVHSSVEGVQLVLIFIVGAGLAVVATKILNILTRKK